MNRHASVRQTVNQIRDNRYGAAQTGPSRAQRHQLRARPGSPTVPRPAAALSNGQAAMEPWQAELERSRDASWDLFLDRYRRLIFSAIRHYAQDYDDVMDVFARVCEALREDDLRRLRSYTQQPVHPARFSTWLVTVVRNLTVDWFRQRDGRRRLSTAARALPPLRRRIFEHVFLHKRSHVETYEVMRSTECVDLSFGQFLIEVSATYRAMGDGRRGRIVRELGGSTPPMTDAEDETETVSERREELEDALSALSAEERVAVELYVVEDMPAEAVARIVGWPNAKAVYNHVYSALGAMRERLEQAALAESVFVFVSENNKEDQ